MPTEPRPYIGGQAVIEGVMMRSPGSMSIVCRRRSGELVVRERPMPPAEKGGPRSWPLVRGVMTLVEALKQGQGALRWSAELFEQDFPEDDDDTKSANKAKTPPAALNALNALSLALVALATQESV